MPTVYGLMLCNKIGSNKLKSLMKSQISTYEQNRLIEKSLMKISEKALKSSQT